MQNANELLYKGKYFSLIKGQDGNEIIQARNEVVVVPVTENRNVILIREPSSAFAKTVLILPGGSINDDELPHETANRELQEEISYRAEQIEFLGELRAFSKYVEITTSVYLGRRLKENSLEKDEIYDIIQQLEPLDNFERLIETGELMDARVIAALFMARNYITKNK